MKQGGRLQLEQGVEEIKIEIEKVKEKLKNNYFIEAYDQLGVIENKIALIRSEIRGVYNETNENHP